MSRPFDTVVIVGVGLIGGSVAAGLRALEDAPRVVGVEPDPEARSWALANGVLDEVHAPEDEAVDVLLSALDAALVVLATPAGAVHAWFDRLRAAGFAGVVTDVASTKSGVYAAAAVLGPPATFIGGHPMAGSERSGVTAARPDLFRGAYYVLTPDDTTDPEAYRRLHALVASLGARPIAVLPAEHDEAVAAISHVPHIAASALTNLAASRSRDGAGVLRLAAGGFKDMTRIAAGSPELWTGICLDNRAAVGRALDGYAEQLREFSGLLEAGDADGVRQWLGKAADVRRSLPAQWVPSSERLSILSIPVSDRPGMVSSVTQAAARAGCNIEDIEIDHTSEDSAVLRLVLTDEGDLTALVDDLDAAGFSPDLRPLEDES